MSKAPQRKKAPRRPPLPAAQYWFLAAGRQRQLLALAAVIFLAAIPFALGKWFEYNSPDPFDGGAYVYSAAHILAGAEIGVQEKPSAQLGTLLLNLLGVKLCGFNDMGPKTIQMLLQVAALAVMFVALHRLYGLLAATLGVIVASVYLSAPLLAKDGNVKEQYMIAFLLLGVSCFIFYELRPRWWYAVLAGALLSWAPQFKQIGLSAIGATGLYLLLQPVFGHKSVKQTSRDAMLLLAGAVAAMAPVYIWILGWNVSLPVPYAFVWHELAKLLPAGPASPSGQGAVDYIAEGRKDVPFSDQWPIVLRYYKLLILPIGLALGAMLVRVFAVFGSKRSAPKATPAVQDRLVLLLAAWWVLDMAFVWISPHSYEQYYLPLNASAAMLGGYLAWRYSRRLTTDPDKTRWAIVGLVGLVVMIATSWHIFFGITISPYSGTPYRRYDTDEPLRQRGYLQRYQDIGLRRARNYRGPWEQVGQYIREHSQPADKIYVWGWYPGIYVQAQRFSSAAQAFSMTRYAPPALARMTAEMLEEFQREMPRFIVDSRKRHIPVVRPPYELWPIMPKGFMGLEKPQFLPVNETIVEAYDKAWSDMLRKEFGDEEAQRYEVLRPFRSFVMRHYRVVNMFGEHVLFERKSPPAGKEPS